MSDEELLKELRLLGQWLQGLGVGPRPAEMETLIAEARQKLGEAFNQANSWLREEYDERAARNQA